MLRNELFSRSNNYLRLRLTWFSPIHLITTEWLLAGSSSSFSIDDCQLLRWIVVNVAYSGTDSVDSLHITVEMAALVVRS